MKRAKVTFFMIAYNEEKRIQRAIQSVLDQTEPDVELYVRNNGSTDRTGEIIREMISKDQRIHLAENKVNWRKNAVGDVSFINEKGAIDIWPINYDTLGDYVAFLDADDRLQPTFTQEMLKAARDNGAEITACGSIFMQNGERPEGQRLPPQLTLHKAEEWTASLQEFGTFVQLYNVFRTWWGKLFRRDFFLRYYDEAWQSIGGPHGTILDTAFMLRYLRRCTHLSCITRPLYLFTAGAGSTYSNWSSPYGVHCALQAEALFDAGIALLEQFSVKTEDNIKFLYRINWAFCWEGMEGLQRVRQIGPEHLNRVIDLLNNRVASVYLADNSEIVCRQLEPVLQAVLRQNCDQLERLYLRYPIRLMYTRKLFQANPASEILPVLIVGILSDIENRHGLGKDLLPAIAGQHPGMAAAMHYVGREWTQRHDNLHNFWITQIQILDDWENPVADLAQRLRKAFDEGRYEEASGLLCQLGQKSPLHRDAVFYRIQLAELIGEHELAVVLAASARVLFGLDIEMQNLCWFVLAQGGG